MGKQRSTKGTGQVRIISGSWRGRRLQVPDLPGLRPSGDRARETLFNWLQPELPGARVLDLFAGSGALGFEAASRGAQMVTLVEQAPQAVAALRAARELLQADAVTIHHGDALAWLGQLPSRSLNLIFLDPPFGTELAAQALQLLETGDGLARNGRLYLESSVQEAPVPVAGNLSLEREKQLGEVRMQLFRKS